MFLTSSPTSAAFSKIHLEQEAEKIFGSGPGSPERSPQGVERLYMISSSFLLSFPTDLDCFPIYFLFD